MATPRAIKCWIGTACVSLVAVAVQADRAFAPPGPSIGLSASLADVGDVSGVHPAALGQSAAVGAGDDKALRQCVPPGDDCWVTLCDGHTQADFSQDPIPAGFFGPGSDPFDGTVVLGGTGMIDTVIERLDQMCFSISPSTDETPIQVTYLDLVSCGPIAVGGSGPWDVHVGMSEVPAPLGTLAATELDPTGGTYTAEFYVQPRYTFTRLIPPYDMREYDTGLEGLPPILMQTTADAPWSQDEAFELCTFDGFAAGMTAHACCEEVCHLSAGTAADTHCTRPPDCPMCPEPTGACCLTDGSCVDGVQEDACASENGFYKGDDSVCLAPEACCFPDHSCLDADPDCCTYLGGNPQGAETACLGDADTDGVDDACDNCPADANPGQEDADQDGYGDVCDTCPGYPDGDDEDHDGIPDACDNCPYVSNPDQTDSDGDYTGDACEPWPDCCGDFEGDNDIDLKDFAAFAVCFGLTHPDERCPQQDFECADLDNDAVVDLNDYSPFAARLGLPPSCNVPPSLLDDVWATDETNPSYDSFATTPIPADFFYPGSPPFTGVIEWSGDPRTMDTRGTTDTVLRRSRAFDFTGGPPACDTVDLELVELMLHSREPIQVGGVEEWSAYATLSPTAPPAGSITACLEHDNGGHFDADYYIQPMYVFIKDADLYLLEQGLIGPQDVNVRVLDTAEEGWTPRHMTMTSVPFVLTIEPPLLEEVYYTAECYGNFIPGIEELPDSRGEDGSGTLGQAGTCVPSADPRGSRMHFICYVDCTPKNHCVYQALPAVAAWGSCGSPACPGFPDVACTTSCDPPGNCPAYHMSLVSGSCPPGGGYTWGFCVKFYTLLGCQPCGSTICPGADADGDRLPDYVETNTGIYVAPQNTGTDPENPDSDGDGLTDGDEVLGTRAGLRLRDFGVNPNHKNVLLEIDWCEDCTCEQTESCPEHSHKPTVAQLINFRAAYAAAPVNNPDGNTGINLIIDYGQGGNFTGGNALDDCPCSFGIDSTLQNYKDDNFAANRKGYFRYQIHCHDISGYDASGLGEVGGDDSLVGLGCWVNLPSGHWMMSHVSMHELGHNLNLRHGGHEDLNYKPSYNSVMNYRYNGGVDTDCNAKGNGVLDYSSGTYITLSENNLNENNGVCGPGHAIDWDCDTMIEAGVNKSITCVANCPDSGCDTVIHWNMQDHDDWSYIVDHGLAPPASDQDFAPPRIIICDFDGRLHEAGSVADLDADRPER